MKNSWSGVLLFFLKNTIALGAESGGGLKFEAGLVEMLRWFANNFFTCTSTDVLSEIQIH